MTDNNQLARAQAFRALHERGTFVIANCWDGGSARILQSLGFPALATSSGAAAGTYGRLDGHISLEEALAHSRIICNATSLPVSADLEKGFGDGPDATAKAIQLAAGVGLVGGSIEDAAGHKNAAIYPMAQATERVAAAARPRARCPSRSRSRPARKTSCTASPTSTTPSSACRLTRRPARTCYSRPRCRRSTPCARCASR